MAIGRASRAGRRAAGAIGRAAEAARIAARSDRGRVLCIRQRIETDRRRVDLPGRRRAGPGTRTERSRGAVVESAAGVAAVAIGRAAVAARRAGGAIGRAGDAARRAASAIGRAVAVACIAARSDRGRVLCIRQRIETDRRRVELPDGRRAGLGTRAERSRGAVVESAAGIAAVAIGRAAGAGRLAADAVGRAAGAARDAQRADRRAANGARVAAEPDRDRVRLRRLRAVAERHAVVGARNCIRPDSHRIGGGDILAGAGADGDVVAADGLLACVYANGIVVDAAAEIARAHAQRDRMSAVGIRDRAQSQDGPVGRYVVDGEIAPAAADLVVGSQPPVVRGKSHGRARVVEQQSGVVFLEYHRVEPEGLVDHAVGSDARAALDDEIVGDDLIGPSGPRKHRHPDHGGSAAAYCRSRRCTQCRQPLSIGLAHVPTPRSHHRRSILPADAVPARAVMSVDYMPAGRARRVVHPPPLPAELLRVLPGRHEFHSSRAELPCTACDEIPMGRDRSALRVGLRRHRALPDRHRIGRRGLHRRAVAERELSVRPSAGVAETPHRRRIRQAREVSWRLQTAN